MDKKSILEEIVKSVEENVLDKTAMENPDDKKVLPNVEKPAEAVKTEQEQVATGKLDELKARLLRDILKENKQETTEEKPLDKVAGQDLVAELRKEAQELVKTASAGDGEMYEELEKVANQVFDELEDLEKAAEEFGKRAAAAFVAGVAGV